MIHFECPACEAGFDVDDRFAGRTGRCKNCGQRTTIPARSTADRPRELAGAVGGAAAGGFRLAPAPDGPARRPHPPVAGGRPLNWLEAVNSQVALAPITEERMPALRRKPSPLDEPSIPGPYKMATAPSLPALKAMGGRPAGAVTRGYRQGMGKVQKLFRWLNESAYLVSTPFLILVLLGLIVGSRSLMVLGATVVVLLNIGRLVAGVANLVVIPFRESPLQGIFFLIPPITFFYLAQNWHKVHRPVKRIVGPIFTIFMVGMAFVVWPWLHSEERPQGSIRDQVKSGFRAAAKEIRKEAEQVPGVNLDDVSKLKSQAAGALKSMKSGDALKSIQERAGDTLKSLEERANAPR